MIDLNNLDISKTSYYFSLVLLVLGTCSYIWNKFLIKFTSVNDGSLTSSAILIAAGLISLTILSKK